MRGYKANGSEAERSGLTAAASLAAVAIAAAAALFLLSAPAADVADRQAVGAVGSTFTVGGFTFTVTSETPNEAELTRIAVPVTGHLEIPRTAEDPGDPGVIYEVTSIASIAFRAAGMTTVTIPDSVRSIEESAFLYCRDLITVTIPDSVTYMGGNIFTACTSLTTVTLSDRMTHIGGYTFWGCTSLTTVTIPPSVTRIGEQAFEGCANLGVVAMYWGTDIMTDTIPPWTVKVYYDGVPTVTAFADRTGTVPGAMIPAGTEIELTAATGGMAAQSAIVGTVPRTNDVAVTGSGGSWSFEKQSYSVYYVTVTPACAVTVESVQGGPFTYTLDNGRTWTPFAVAPLGRHQIDVPSGLRIEIKALPDEGHIAVWRDGGGGSTIGNTLAFTVFGDVTVKCDTMQFRFVPGSGDDPFRGADPPDPLPGPSPDPSPGTARSKFPWVIFLIVLLIALGAFALIWMHAYRKE